MSVLTTSARLGVVLLVVGQALACGGGQHAEHGQHHGTHAEHHGAHAEHHGAHAEHHGAHAEHHGEHDHHADSMRHDFSDAARWSKVFDNPERDVWQKPDEVVSLMKIEPGMAVADIGAGTGYFLGRLSKAVGSEGSVVGLDIEENLVAHMSDRAGKEGWGNVTARVVAPDDPGLTAGSVDRLLIVDTWHHISDREVYAKKLFDGLKPGGALYVVDFEPESSKGPPKKHKLASSSIVAELVSAGFSAKALDETLPEQYVIEAAKP